MPECNQDELRKNCGCSYTSCSRQGKCCECIAYHITKNELPGCVFAKISKEAEESYNRDFKYFAKLVLNN